VDAVIAHSAYGRDQLVSRLGLDAARVHIVPHGAFAHLTEVPDERPLPSELLAVSAPVVLFFGLLRPYKGIDVLLEAWRSISDAELWIVGHPRMPLAPLQARAPNGVRFVPRYISDPELAAFFRRADLVVLPYVRTERFDQSGVMATALAFGKPLLLSDIGSFREVAAAGAARLVPPEDPGALQDALVDLVGDAAQRDRLAAAARAAAAGPFSWERAAEKTLALYQQLG
jgi:glycosyltransferase involved in cell wall biosynthesis